jgi:hypothetical protein
MRALPSGSNRPEVQEVIRQAIQQGKVQAMVRSDGSVRITPRDVPRTVR